MIPKFDKRKPSVETGHVVLQYTEDGKTLNVYEASDKTFIKSCEAKGNTNSKAQNETSN